MFLIWILPVVAGVLSIVCSIGLLTTWCLLPEWRTLHAFITLNEVVSGTVATTLFLLINYLFSNHWIGYILWLWFLPYCDVLSSCWTLCASIGALLKIVIGYDKQIRHEKALVTLFAFGLATLMFVIFIFMQEFESLFIKWVLEAVCYVCIVIHVIIYIYKIVMACRRSAFSNESRNMTAPMHARFASQVVILFCEIHQLFYFMNMIYVWAYVISLTLSIMRFIPLSIAIMYDQPAREMWRKKYSQNGGNGDALGGIVYSKPASDAEVNAEPPQIV